MIGFFAFLFFLACMAVAAWQEHSADRRRRLSRARKWAELTSLVNEHHDREARLRRAVNRATARLNGNGRGAR